MSVTATEFRKNLFQLLEEVNETGTPLKISLKDRTFILQPEERASKLSKLKPQDLLNGDAGDLLNLDWSEEWSEKPI